MAQVAIISWNKDGYTDQQRTLSGPSLPIEFSRKSLAGKLVPVIDDRSQTAKWLPTFLEVVSVSDIYDAFAIVRAKELSPTSKMKSEELCGLIDGVTRPDNLNPTRKAIHSWFHGQIFNKGTAMAVIWNQIQPNVILRDGNMVRSLLDKLNESDDAILCYNLHSIFCVHPHHSTESEFASYLYSKTELMNILKEYPDTSMINMPTQAVNKIREILKST